MHLSRAWEEYSSTLPNTAVFSAPLNLKQQRMRIYPVYVKGSLVEIKGILRQLD
jgi:hypothetical protein